MIPANIPLVVRVVKNGSGGPNKDSIPIREDLGGPTIGYLPTGFTIRIVDPAYPGAGNYRKEWAGNIWVDFIGKYVDLNGLVQVAAAGNKDYLCEETSHLYPVEEPPGDTVTYEVVSEHIIGARRLIELKRV
jgi:hypothetical protein